MVVSDQLGLVATGCLIALWLHAIVFTWRRDLAERVKAGARVALFVAFIKCLLGAVPMASIAGGWMLALGALLGVADANEP
jgi:hypothetical protein